MLDVSHVRKDFGSVRAVRDVSFSIARGATFGLLGPNGAGKTTTMRMILGIYVPDGGTITWNGASIAPSTRRHAFGYLPEERGLYGKMRVREQIQYFARLHGLADSQAQSAAKAWIDRLDLSEYADRPCAELSKGNQQKVQVACSAAHSPQLLILDEPFSGLDPVNAWILMEALGDLKASGTTLVLSSHQMWQLEELCDAFCVITDGENRASGTLTELRRGFPTRTIRVRPDDPQVAAGLEQVAGSPVERADDGTLRCTVSADTDFAAMLRALAQREPITQFEAIEPTLQDIYLRAISAGAANAA